MNSGLFMNALLLWNTCGATELMHLESRGHVPRVTCGHPPLFSHAPTCTDKREFTCFYSLSLTSAGASAARTGLTRQSSVQGHKGWEHGHTAEVSEDANLATHTQA